MLAKNIYQRKTHYDNQSFHVVVMLIIFLAL